METTLHTASRDGDAKTLYSALKTLKDPKCAPPPTPDRRPLRLIKYNCCINPEACISMENKRWLV